MFCNSFAKSMKLYGLVFYGKSAKTNIKKIDSVQGRILRVIFHRNKYDSMNEMLFENKINTMCDLFINVVVLEVFRELRLESPLKFLNFEGKLTFHREARWNFKGFFPPINARCMRNEKSLANFSMTAFNWLKELNFIPSQMKMITVRQLWYKTPESNQ